MKSCCKDAWSQDTPETPQPRKNRLGKWFKRIGIAGFLFFLLKGIVWLFVIYGGLHIASC